MKKNTLLLFVFLAAMAACSPKNELQTGTWRGVIPTDGGDLPFGLEISKNADSSTYSILAINGEERLALDTAYFKGDSLVIPMDIFDANLTAKIKGDEMTGTYKKMRSNGTFLVGNFKAKRGNLSRFEGILPTKSNISGKWSTLFRSAEDPADTTLSIGVFKQNGSIVNGTFLTPTGDYRYLSGNMSGDSLWLSCFDGNHVFLFKAKLNTATKTMEGKFWSNLKNVENWTATANEKATLPDAKILTFLKPGFNKFAFDFPDAEGKKISLQDERFKGKVTVVQIMGSWCPNCMDETKFLAPWYLKNKVRGVEIVALAFEKSTDLAVSGPKLERLRKRFSVPYPILLAGSNDKEMASKTLPMLNKILSFPTTIFIDKKGNVRAIHTGFSGPGTGQYYDDFVADFDRQIDGLLAESN
jgi:thiol-disulfide isomerase/thioredoxin